MCRTLHITEVLVYLTVFAIAVQAMPSCAIYDEECREKFMHPDFKEDSAFFQGRVQDGEQNTEFWRSQGKEFIASKLTNPSKTKQAKNVIMFLGDGLGLTTIAAARTLLGGEESQLAFEKFPYVGLAKTYAIDKIVPDSANTATAYLCGVKGFYGTIGVNGMVERENCETMQDVNNHVTSIAQWAIDAGKSAGVITNTRLTHASLAGAYAHIGDRDWEDDAEVKTMCGLNSGVDDIAHQLIHGTTGSKLKVMMGGGKKHFVDAALYENGHRSDGRNLIEEFQNLNSRNAYVDTKEDLINFDVNKADRLLGLFHDDHFPYHLNVEATSTQPTLEEMTRKTIEFLSKDDNGYFVLIEGGRIDAGHHANTPRIALDETLEFSKAIEAAREMTYDEETLIVVTADHSHVFTFAGYPNRGNDIFGQSPTSTNDKNPFMVLSYTNGPGYEKFYDSENAVRRNPATLMTGAADDRYASTLPVDSETHGGEDVPVYATGSWANLFTGVYEQNTIPHMMAYALCVGNGLKACD